MLYKLSRNNNWTLGHPIRNASFRESGEIDTENLVENDEVLKR